MDFLGSLCKPGCIAAGALITVAAGPADAAIVTPIIDSFSGPSFVETDTNPPGGATVTLQTNVDLDGLGGIISSPFGTTRGLSLAATTTDGITSAAVITGGVLKLNVGADTLATLELTYDDFTDVDITDDGDLQAFALSLPFVQGSGIVTVEVFDGVATSSASATVSGTGGTDAAMIAFSAFNGVDFNSIDRIVLSISTDEPASDFSLDTFLLTAVPEPASLALLGLGGLAMFRRR